MEMEIYRGTAPLQTSTVCFEQR